jgi:Fur family iron response transcriptional regulator
VDLKATVEARLRDHGVKPTPQRMEIGMLLLASPTHMSAEQIIGDLRERGSRISKATVYNTLNLFSRHGIAREVAVDPNRLVYDSTTEPHHHFYNIDTGELTDIGQSEIEVRRLPDLPPGTEAQEVEVIVRLRNKR